MTTPTRRLFHEDAYRRSFEAHVVATRAAAGGPFDVCLDQTAFYATSGGQPFDRGRLGGHEVLDVIDEEGQVWHRLAGPIEGAATGEIDWDRRFDHMQQHTGQHILSQAFIQVAGAETLSFHLGAEDVTIDLSRLALTDADLTRVEDRANAIVEADLTVRAHWTTREELGRFPLRKPPVVEGPIRIVEVDGFDWSACGGTHVGRTGEVGLIKVLSREKVRSGLRISFLCGGRARRDYAWKHALIKTTAGRLSTLDRDLGDAIVRLEAENGELRRRVRGFEEERLDREAGRLADAAEACGSFRLVVDRRPGAGLEEVQWLAGRIRTRPGLVALLAGLGADGRVSLAFARSGDVPADMNAALKRALAVLDGRGGGRPEMAQGSGTGPERLEAALEAALRGLTDPSAGQA